MTNEQAKAIRALREARDLAMKNTVAARVPECGDFGAIAQGLDWAINQLTESSTAAPIAAGVAPEGSAAASSEAAAYIVDYADIGEGWGRSCFYEGDVKKNMESAVSYSRNVRKRECTITPLFAAHPVAGAAVAELKVWYGSMPESNGKRNWTAILHAGDMVHGLTLDRSEYPDRVRYEADRARHLIGELKDPPFILDYDADKHSGYIAPELPSTSEAVAPASPAVATDAPSIPFAGELMPASEAASDPTGHLDMVRERAEFLRACEADLRSRGYGVKAHTCAVAEWDLITGRMWRLAKKSAVAEPAEHAKRAEPDELAWHKESLARHVSKLAAVWQGIKDAIKKELDQECGDEPFNDLHAVLAELRQARAALQQNAGAALDAARYRWIRDTENNGYSIGGETGIGKFHVTQKIRNGEGLFYFGEQLDKAIDAAIAAAPTLGEEKG